MAGGTSTTARGGKTGADRYLALVREWPLRPIRSEAELDRAIALLDSLSDREALSPEEHDYLLVLAGLVECYEDEHHPIPAVRGVPMLRYLIDSRGVTQAEAAAGAGLAESALSEILSGKRKLGIRAITALAGYFKVAPGLFIPG